MLNSFLINNGTYGPAHDPYSFTDVTFININGESIKIHYGINTKITLPNGQIINDFDFPKEVLTPDEIFAAYVGLDQKTINRLLQKQERRENEFLDPFGSPGMYI